MRIALAQLNPISGDIDGNTAKILDALADAASQRRRSAGHAGDGGARLLHRRPGRGRELPRGQRARDAARRRRRPRHHRRRRLHRSRSRPRGTTTARFASTTPRLSCSDGRVLQRAHKSLLPNYRYFDDKRFFTPAIARDPVDVTVGAAPGVPSASACRSARTCGTRSTTIKPLPELAAKGAEVLLNINASPFYPGKRHERDALIRQHVERLRTALRLRQHGGRRRQRQEHHPVRRREPRVRRGRPAARDRPRSSARRCSSSTCPATRRDDAGRPAVDLPPIDRERETVRRAGHGAARLHAQDRLHRRDRAGVGGHRFRAGARDRRRGGRRRARLGVQPAVAVQHRDDESDRGAAREGARRPLRRHPDPGDRRRRRERRSRRHAHPITKRVHARRTCRRASAGLLMMAESNDTGALLDLVRQRDRDRARLRHAVRRHVRRHLAHRRSLEGRRLPPRPVRQRASRRGENPGRRRSTITPSAELARRPVRSVRLSGRRAASSARSSSAG